MKSYTVTGLFYQDLNSGFVIIVTLISVYYLYASKSSELSYCP